MYEPLYPIWNRLVFSFSEVKWSKSHPVGSDPRPEYWSGSILQGTFPTQGSNPGLLHCKQILYQLSHLRPLLNLAHWQLLSEGCWGSWSEPLRGPLQPGDLCVIRHEVAWYFSKQDRAACLLRPILRRHVVSVLRMLKQSWAPRLEWKGLSPFLVVGVRDFGAMFSSHCSSNSWGW